MKTQGSKHRIVAAQLALMLAAFASACSPDQSKDPDDSEADDPSADEGSSEDEPSKGSAGADENEGSEEGDSAGESSESEAEGDSDGDDASESGGEGDDDSSESGGEGGDDGSEKKKEVPDEFKGKKNPFDADDKEAQEAGKPLYEEHCEGCHGKDGTGELPGIPDMTTKSLTKWPDDWTYWKVLKGGSEMMPAAEGILSEEEIWQCITYVRSFGK